MSIDDPNIVLPLATSYNERGVAGYTHVVTNAEDQRKVNCFYEVAKNPMTGKGTLTLSKRPGVTVGANSFGVSSQDVYLIINTPNDLVNSGKSLNVIAPWVFSITGGNILASDSSGSKTIASVGAGFLPAYIDRTVVSSIEEAVLQIKSPVTSAAQKVFYSSAINTWTEISDGDFTGLIHRGKMEHLDGFALIIDKNNIIWNSDVNSLQSWTATSFIAKQIVQDIPVGLAKLNNQILAFGDDTVELFYNAGNTVGSPLGRIPYKHQRLGLIPPSISSIVYGHYYCTIGNRIFFVGRDSGGIKTAGVFSYDGNTFEKVSTNYIEKVLSEVVNTSFYSVNAIGHNGRKAVAILLTSPNVTSQRWLMFYPELNEWFEWTSTVFSPINSGEHFLSCGTNLKNKVYTFPSNDNWQDAEVSYQWLTQFRLPTNGSSIKRMVFYGVEADTDTSSNFISVDVSDNDCQSFYSLQPLDLTWDRKINFRGGSYTKRHVRLSATDDRPKRLHNFIANVID